MLEKPQNEGHSKVASLPCNIEFFYSKNHAKADIKDLSLVILSNFSYFYFLYCFLFFFFFLPNTLCSVVSWSLYVA